MVKLNAEELMDLAKKYAAKSGNTYTFRLMDGYSAMYNAAPFMADDKVTICFEGLIIESNVPVLEENGKYYAYAFMDCADKYIPFLTEKAEGKDNPQEKTSLTEIFCYRNKEISILEIESSFEAAKADVIKRVTASEKPWSMWSEDRLIEAVIGNEGESDYEILLACTDAFGGKDNILVNADEEFGDISILPFETEAMAMALMEKEYKSELDFADNIKMARFEENKAFIDNFKHKYAWKIISKKKEA